jgi:hypothetical protein
VAGSTSPLSRRLSDPSRRDLPSVGLPTVVATGAKLFICWRNRLCRQLIEWRKLALDKVILRSEDARGIR